MSKWWLIGALVLSPVVVLGVQELVKDKKKTIRCSRMWQEIEQLVS